MYNVHTPSLSFTLTHSLSHSHSVTKFLSTLITHVSSHPGVESPLVTPFYFKELSLALNHTTYMPPTLQDPPQPPVLSLTVPRRPMSTHPGKLTGLAVYYSWTFLLHTGSLIIITSYTHVHCACTVTLHGTKELFTLNIHTSVRKPIPFARDFLD